MGWKQDKFTQEFKEYGLLKSDHCGMETRILLCFYNLYRLVKIRPLWDGNIVKKVLVLSVNAVLKSDHCGMETI